MATMKETGQQTAAGFQKSNAPIPSNTHQPFPSGAVPGGVPTVDTAKIAPTSGPAGDGEPAAPGELERGTDPSLLLP
jgi:hypothetical protein